MSREILFRGKDCYTGEWIEGFYDGRNIVNWIERTADLNNPETKMCIPSSTMIIHDTLGRFTGLTDKNGKRIFEGDVIKDNEGDFAKIIYDKELASFGVRYRPGTYSVDPMETIPFYEIAPSWEIVGNIYDNPDLTEADDE